MSNGRVFVGSLFVLLASSSLQADVILLNEGFNNVSTLPGNGWAMVNNSSPLGSTGWFQGDTNVFTSQAGAPETYIAANFNNAVIPGNISNWLITPVLSLQYDLQLVFFTRTELNSPFPDRLELRLSSNGASTNVGTSDSSVGDFTNLVLSVNPSLSIGGYPEDWTQITANFVGVGVPASGRFAFRYNVSDNLDNADYIGIDTVSVTQAQAVPEPATLGLFASVLGAIVCRRAFVAATRAGSNTGGIRGSASRS